MEYQDLISTVQYMQIAYSHIHHVLIECQMIQHFITGLSDISITFLLIRKYSEHEKLLIDHHGTTLLLKPVLLAGI
mgnify:FL=1